MTIPWWVLLIGALGISAFLGSLLAEHAGRAWAGWDEDASSFVVSLTVWVVGFGVVSYIGLIIMDSPVPTIVYVVLNAYGMWGWLIAIVRIAVPGYPGLEGKHPLPEEIKRDEYDRAQQAFQIISDRLKHVHISPNQKSQIRRQARKVLDNIAEGLWRIQRLDDMAELSKESSLDQAAASELRTELQTKRDRFVSEIAQLADMLGSLPVSLMKVEVARDNKAVSRIIWDLNESNLRVKDLAESWKDLSQSNSTFRR